MHDDHKGGIMHDADVYKINLHLCVTSESLICKSIKVGLFFHSAGGVRRHWIYIRVPSDFIESPNGSCMVHKSFKLFRRRLIYATTAVS